MRNKDKTKKQPPSLWRKIALGSLPIAGVAILLYSNVNGAVDDEAHGDTMQSMGDAQGLRFPVDSRDHTQTIELQGSSQEPEPPTIFVSYASYLNKDVSHMLENLYKNAKYPQNVHVGLLLHSYGDEPKCEPKAWAKVCNDSTQFCPRDNVQVITNPKIPYSGPSDAHHMTRKLYKKQHFYLMAHDSTAFVREWDRILTERYVAAVRMAGHDRIALSHPVPRWLMYSQREMDEDETILTWRRATTNDFGYFDVYPDVANRTIAPFQQFYATDALIFAPAAIVEEVPRDPGIQYLLGGGDLLYSARLWTSKWDMYHPGVSVAFYKQAYREAKAWAYVDKTWKVLRKAAINRLQRILSLKETNFNIVGEREQTFATFMTERNLDIFGVGQRRGLTAYWQQLRSHLLIDP